MGALSVQNWYSGKIRLTVSLETGELQHPRCLDPTTLATGVTTELAKHTGRRMNDVSLHRHIMTV